MSWALTRQHDTLERRHPCRPTSRQGCRRSIFIGVFMSVCSPGTMKNLPGFQNLAGLFSEENLDLLKLACEFIGRLCKTMECPMGMALGSC